MANENNETSVSSAHKYIQVRKAQMLYKGMCALLRQMSSSGYEGRNVRYSAQARLTHANSQRVHNLDIEINSTGGSHQQEPPATPGIACICLRPLGMVSCRLCGYYTKGRISQTCPEHVNVSFLMDFSRCPYCRSCELDEFKI